MVDHKSFTSINQTLVKLFVGPKYKITMLNSNTVNGQEPTIILDDDAKFPYKGVYT